MNAREIRDRISVSSLDRSISVAALNRSNAINGLVTKTITQNEEKGFQK